MDITPFLEGLRRDLTGAAEAVGPEGKAAAERMMLALEPAVRLALMELLSQAAAEITAELAAGTVEVRLRGREPELVVDVPAPVPPLGTGPAERLADTDPEGEGGDDAIARVSLRIPESVKARAEELAARSGHSLNGWIVSVLRAATSPRAAAAELDLSSIPIFDDKLPGRRGRSRRLSGWV